MEEQAVEYAQSDTLKARRTIPHIVCDTYIGSHHMKTCMKMRNTELGAVFASREGGKAYGASMIAEIRI